MKRKNPFMIFLLGVVTLSFYFYYMLFDNMKRINRLKNKAIFNVEKRVTIFASAFVLGTIAMSIIRSNACQIDGEMLVNISNILNVSFLLLIIYNVVSLVIEIKTIQKSAGMKKTISTSTAALLTFLFMFSFPYIQSHINMMIDTKVVIEE